MSIVVNNKVRRFVSNKIGVYINSPEQRLIQGITALGMQPLIDYYNHKADDETRAVSVARTIGKIIAGTVAGVAIRYIAIHAAKQFSAYAYKEIIGGYVKKVGPKRRRDIFMPNYEFAIPSKTPKEFKAMHENYAKTMGTLLATGAMVFTNILIDAPLTRIITKHLTPTVKKHRDNQKAKKMEVDNGSI